MQLILKTNSTNSTDLCTMYDLFHANLKEQIKTEYEKALHERNAVDCKRPNIVFLASSLDGIFPFIKSAA